MPTYLELIWKEKLNKKKCIPNIIQLREPNNGLYGHNVSSTAACPNLGKKGAFKDFFYEIGYDAASSMSSIGSTASI